MPQNDFSIADANGATVRADINSALQALASQNSGASAPATTYANQFWHDDANDQMKIRDEANTVWIIIASKIGSTWIPYYSVNPIGNMSLLSYTAINQNLTMSAKSILMASSVITSGTPDFATNAGNTVSITSTATANTLGTVQAGVIAVIHYGVAITVTHNATSRILPTGANIVTAVGDVEIALSLGSGNWRTIAYMRASGAPLTGVAASQAEMEAASSTTVYTTPGREHYHPGVAKAHGFYTSSGGVPTLQSSYNISSLTDSGVGTATWNFTTAFSSANHEANGMCQRDATNSAAWPAIEVGYTPTTTAQKTACVSDGAGLVEVTRMGASFFGDQ